MAFLKEFKPALIVLDVGLVASVLVLTIASEPIAIFHLIFVLATMTALIYPLVPFLARALPALSATAAILIVKWQNEELPGAEVGELPLLMAIVAVVFAVAERKRRTDAQIEGQHEAVHQLEEARAQQLTDQLVASRQREMTRDIASIVAHDINGLLTHIQLEMDLLEESSPDSAESQATVEAVNIAVGDAGATLRDLVSLTQDHPSSARCDLNTVVSRVVSLLRRTALPNVDVETNLKAVPLLVPLNAVRVVHIVMNLSRNAMEAMPDGGHLTITTSWRTSVDGPTAVLSIGDTGHGLPPELAAHVFEPLYTLRQSEGGVGVGLYSVKQMVSESRGEVFMDTRLGGPTLVCVELPLLFVPVEHPDAVTFDRRD